MKDNRPYDKLYNWEVPPPVNIWNDISKELDHQKFSDKLLHAEIDPPKNIWNKIEQTLYPKERSIPIFKYIAVAASVLGLAFVGNYAYQNYLQQQVLNDANYLAITANGNQSIIEIFTTESQNSYTKSSNTNTNLEANNIKKTKISKPEKVYFASNMIPEKIKFDKEPTLVEVRTFTDNDGNLVFNPNMIADPNSNYLTITGPNGQQTRISSKFLPMITEINASKNNRGFYRNYPIPESENWRQRFSEWRKKLIQEDSTKIPATNLIELINKNTNGENPK